MAKKAATVLAKRTKAKGKAKAKARAPQLHIRETASTAGDETLQRVRVPGGWLYIATVEASDSDKDGDHTIGIAISTSFVPDKR